MKNVLLILIALAALVGLIVCGIQFVMAVRYFELGRVAVYFALGCICFSALVYLRDALRNQNKS